VPRRIADDEEMPRRRSRGAQAVAIEAGEKRGLLMRMLLRSPKDLVAATLAAAVIVAIIANALFLQAGRHPSPMFGSVVILPPPAPVTAAASPLPRPRPIEADARPVEPQPVEAKPAEPVRASDPMTNLIKSNATSLVSPSNVMRPPAPSPSRVEITHTAASKRIAAVQRALTEYGYGQLKPTGTIGSDTQAAISKFERDRKLPATGQISDRLVRELTAMIGHPIE
jgi:Putative peptidoglycan binding domain